MTELILRVSFARLPAIALATLPLLIFVWLPSAAGTWLGIQWMQAASQEGVFDMALGTGALGNVQHFFSGVLPSMPSMRLAQALNAIAWLGGIVCSPLLHGALTLLVVGAVVGVKVGAGGAWRGALRRGFHLVVTEVVKAVLLFLVFFFSVVAAVIAVAVVTALAGALLGRDAGAGLALIDLFAVVFLGGLIAFGPAVYLFLLWIFTVPLVLFEGRDVVSALRESAARVRAPADGGAWGSHAMRLTGLLTLVGLILLIAMAPVAAPWMVWAGRGVRRAMEGDFALLFSVPGGIFAASVFLWVLVRALLAAIWPGAVALYYADLRQRAPGPAGADAAAELGGYVGALCARSGERPAALAGVGGRGAAPLASPAPPEGPPASAEPPRLPPSWPDG